MSIFDLRDDDLLHSQPFQFGHGGPRGTFPDRPGAAYHAVLGPGKLVDITVYPLLWGGGVVCLGPCGDREDGGFNARWDYYELDAAVAAAHAWDGVGDPPGPWHRKQNGAGPPVRRSP